MLVFIVYENDVVRYVDEMFDERFNCVVVVWEDEYCVMVVGWLMMIC